MERHRDTAYKPQPDTDEGMVCSLVRLFDRPVEFKKVLDELPLGIVFISLQRRVLQMNSHLECMTGFSADSVTGLPCWDVLRCNQCVNSCLIREAGRSKLPVTRHCDLVNRERRRLGVKITAVPVHDKDGRLSGFMEVVHEDEQAESGRDSLEPQLQLGSFVGRSEQLKKLFRVVPAVAQTDSSVLITGETGTGKDLLAEIIHRNSERFDGPFIKINCGSLPENLLESELFGHSKGAFTGAASDKMGRLRLAHNGSVFLTEIGDLSLTLQIKLLTFLDDKVVHPLGSTKGYQTDVRVIAATHRNLEHMVREGNFRQDLLYRLNVVRLHLPPLREREGDVPLLLDHFLKYFGARFSKSRISFRDRARNFLLHYAYPGNIREIRNIVEYAVNICGGEKIDLEDLPAYLFDQDFPAVNGQEEQSALEGGRVELESGESWPAIERKMILEAMLACRGKKAEAAEWLGWSRSKLWRKIKEHGVE
ncbi:MAG: sigma-54 interaction domain-containing protein [Desulfonatronovibrionaceae bacterium]